MLMGEQPGDGIGGAMLPMLDEFGDVEIAGEMRPGDLQPVRLEIVDQQLAEAAFLAQRLLGAGGDGREPRSSSSSSEAGVNGSSPSSSV